MTEAMPERYRELVYVMAYAGLRIGEATALSVENLDLLRGRLRVERAYTEVGGKLYLGEPKTKTSRGVVSLPRVVRGYLSHHLEMYPTAGLVFTAPNGGPIRRNTFRRRVWMPALTRAGIAHPLPHPHDLRHTAIATAIRAGAHPKEIQAMAGHSSITVTLDTCGTLFSGQDEVLARRIDALLGGQMVGNAAHR